MMSWLAEQADVLLFDLDGVVYLGPEPIEHAVQTIAKLRELGKGTGFVTNNAARSPSAVSEHLHSLGIPADDHDIITSGQAAAGLLSEVVAPGSRVLVVGTTALVNEVSNLGFEAVTGAEDQPAAVIQGYHPELPWWLINEACAALQAGAKWVQTNTDRTRPTDRGLQPGAGPQMDAVAVAAPGVRPLIAGKPHAPLLQAAMKRMGGERTIFVGDRLDTDIAGANAVGIDSLQVFTGAHGKWDLLSAAADSRPTTIGMDLAALLQPARVATWRDRTAVVGQQAAAVRNGHVHLVDGVPTGADEQLDALWAVLQICWNRDVGDADDVVESLDLLP